MVDASADAPEGARIEGGFQELEIVAYVDRFKVVGVAYFGVGQRATSRRASDFIRSFNDTRLTLADAVDLRLAFGRPPRDVALRRAQPRQGRLPLRSRRRGRRPGPTRSPRRRPTARPAPPDAAARRPSPKEATTVYAVDVLIPTARFAFSVEAGEVRVLPEHRSPEAYAAYRRLRAEQSRGRHDDVPQHGPAARRSRARRSDDPRRPGPAAPERARRSRRWPRSAWVSTTSTSSRSRTRTTTTPARASTCRFPSPCTSPRSGPPHWPVVEGILAARELRVLRGSRASSRPGVRWALTPGHTPGRRHVRGRHRGRADGDLRRHRRPVSRPVRRHGAGARAGRRRPPRLVAAHPRVRAAPPHRRPPAAVRPLSSVVAATATVARARGPSARVLDSIALRRSRRVRQCPSTSIVATTAKPSSRSCRR